MLGIKEPSASPLPLPKSEKDFHETRRDETRSAEVSPQAPRILTMGWNCELWARERRAHSSPNHSLLACKSGGEMAALEGLLVFLQRFSSVFKLFSR